MAYYSGVGDYYRGDYYRGDLKSFLRKAGGAAVGFITGGPAGALAAVLPRKPAIAPIPVPPGGIRSIAVPATPVLSREQMRQKMTFAPMAPSVPRAAQQHNGCPSGFHPCKSKDGCKDGPCVRNRRMNPANPRALRRGLRRVSGFAKLAQRAKRDIGRAATAAGVRRSAPRKKGR